jgi:thiamine-phosphate pyrophosphorylase
MKIIVISTPYRLQEEHTILTQLFENGLTSFHLRKPRWRFSEMKEYLQAIPAQYHNRIITHTHHKLVKQFKLQGVHYTSVHLQPTFKNWWHSRRLARYTQDLVKTASYKKLATLAEKSDINYDYVFLTPVFDSITGKFQSGLYDDSLTRTLQQCEKKVIAMGGVDIRRIERIQEIGFSGMALNNCLWKAADPLEEFCKITARCRELGIWVE